MAASIKRVVIEWGVMRRDAGPESVLPVNAELTIWWTASATASHRQTSLQISSRLR